MDIDGWLRRIGLAQYAEIFRANDIDIELLRRLTNDDLKDIGVVSFGHRKKLLEAIAELAGAVAVSPQPALIVPKAHDAAERRQVTVMFSDLVGSTTLSARMDPEDLREVISAYQKCVAETVERFGGFVAKYIDGLEQRLLLAILAPTGKHTTLCALRPCVYPQATFDLSRGL